MSKSGIQWLPKPDDDDFDAAESYLGLLFPKAAVKTHMKRLRGAGIVEIEAKDLFRASGLPSLASNESHVAKDHAKILARKKLSPLIVLKASTAERGKIVIADGYHRLCAVYAFDEDAKVPCKIA